MTLQLILIGQYLLKRFSFFIYILSVLFLISCSSLNQKHTTKVSSGSAFVVEGNGYIVTANHVVKNKNYVYIKLASGKRWIPAEFIRADEKLDVALLRIPVHLKPLKLAEWSSVPVGLEIVTIGYPMPAIEGMSQKITQGIINSQLGMKDSPDYFQFSAGVQKGSSGGPILSLDHKVVGMVVKKIGQDEKSTDAPQNINYALNAEALYHFLRISFGDKLLINKLNLETRLPIFQLYEESTESVMAVIASDQPL
ncbi:MAG: serine protease [Chitinophagia bacterium]|nr:serine protease [Chitinophagia bacterium]